jgi:hypothetical protein
VKLFWESVVSPSTPCDRVIQQTGLAHFRLIYLICSTDQGVGGITISLSKAALYTLGAGIQPNRILPVVLDPGTDNHIQFSDPLYLGWKRGRVRGKLYE